MKIWLRGILFIIFFIAMPSAEAHPHIFITPQATIIMSDHFVSQINVEWDFDDMSSALFSESYGTNRDDIWNSIFPVTQLTQDGRQVPRAGYYTNIEIDGTSLPDITPANFKVDYNNGNLQCKFTLYLNQTVDNSLKISFTDPTIYNDFDVQEENFEVWQQQNGVHYTLRKETATDLAYIHLTL